MVNLRTFVAGLALAGLGWSATASAQSIGGRYEVQGHNPNGSTYGGTAEIILTSDTTCRIRWETGSTSEGICMRNGHAFAASYRLGKSFGLVIYNLHPDGSMQGIWTIADEPGAGTETLIPYR